MDIKLENISKNFGQIQAVKNLSVHIGEGKLFSLLGPSGCGKSTILAMLAGVEKVSEGKIYFGGEDVTNVPPENRGIGMVFQNYALYPHMSVLENICFPLEIQKVKKAERLKRVKETAALVHIDHMLDRKPGKMSGGQQQRVAIARALVKNPKVLLMDEPLSNLDARLRLEMREEIRRIQKETGVTTIFVTHDQEEAMSISDSIMLMNNGELMQIGRPQELYENPQNNFVAKFLGNPPISILHGVVKEGAFFPKDSTKKFAHEKCGAISEGTKVLIGIRSEAVSLLPKDTQGAVEAELIHTSLLGREQISILKIGDTEIHASFNEEIPPSLSENKLYIGLKEKGIFFFDALTGRRLA